MIYHRVVRIFVCSLLLLSTSAVAQPHSGAPSSDYVLLQWANHDPSVKTPAVPTEFCDKVTYSGLFYRRGLDGDDAAR